MLDATCLIMEDIVFVGDWVKDRVLGSGSFGVVVLWKHKDTDEKLAIKTCKWGDELTEKHKERWTTEVEMVRNCKNPNIVGAKELPIEFLKGLEKANPSGLPILCMEFCSGGDLRQLLNKCDSCSGLKEYDVKQILNDIGNAMKFLHINKITHRDLKPENIVVQIQEDIGRSDLQSQVQQKCVYKLIDLGYAKDLDSKSVCASFVGTLQYLAPEILYSKTYSNSVDFWSLGLLAFEITCGVRPFLPSLAPVQWMPHVKKKTSENICVYETYHGDIEYSNEIFAENFISKPFKVLIEKWLRVALEWDPKLRGREITTKGVTFNIPDAKDNETRANNIIIFNLLEDILSRKIIKIFSVATLCEFAYEINEETTVETLKTWIKNDTKDNVEELILISPTTCIDILNCEKAMKYWNNTSNTMLYLFNRTCILKDNIDPIVPKAVQRSLEHPKALYNFKYSKNLYKCGFYFVMSQKEKYDSLINSLFVRTESLKQEGKELLLKHNMVDKSIGKLLTKQETIANLIETGKKHINALKESRSSTNFLGGFDKIFKDSDDLTEKINKVQTAWSQLTVRLQSAARRSSEIMQSDLNNLFATYNYHQLLAEVTKVYFNYRKNERQFRVSDKQCHDIIKICYNCLKLRSKILVEIRHQPFVLKIMDISIEFSKISDIISTALENTERLVTDMASITDELTNCIWITISLLSSNVGDLADLPYSVVSFQKQDFKIGERVTNNHVSVKNDINGNNEDLRVLLEENIKLRHNNSVMNNKFRKQKDVLQSFNYDFSYLEENNS